MCFILNSLIGKYCSFCLIWRLPLFWEAYDIYHFLYLCVFCSLRNILRRIQNGDVPKEDLYKNLEYAASVLESVYVDETRWVKCSNVVVSLPGPWPLTRSPLTAVIKAGVWSSWRGTGVMTGQSTHSLMTMQ